MTEPNSGAPEPCAVPWPRPSLSLVPTDPSGSEWSSTVSARLADLAAQPGVEVILVECPESRDADAGLCPRLRGVARAAGNVVVFREIGSAEGSLLGLPPLWEPCPPGTADLRERLRAAGVERPAAPETG